MKTPKASPTGNPSAVSTGSQQGIPVKRGTGGVSRPDSDHLLRGQADTDFSKTMLLISEAGLEPFGARIKEAWDALPVTESGCREAFVDLLAAFARRISGDAALTCEGHWHLDTHALREAQRYITENSTKCLKLPEVAKAVGLSPNYFCRKFRDFTGLSFTDYLAGIRVRNAARLLLKPGLRISEVAFAAGFNSISQFNRIFQAKMGLAPSDYRRRRP